MLTGSNHTPPAQQDGTGERATVSLPSPLVGAPALYRSIDCGSDYPCIITAVRDNGLVDVRIDGTDNLEFTRLMWWTGTDKDCPKRAVRTTERNSGETQDDGKTGRE